ncbi:MAG: leucine-rich repeat domain-containing protein, partial [Clostridiales bacterium]|nr:leucine-rich repeat domain-containing protein [Clostridiales bacterium]
SYLAYTFGATNKYSAGSSVVPKSLAAVTVTGGNAIESYAFYGCTDILSINLPQTTETIGDSAFADCRSLQSIELPNGVTRIGDRAFNGCSAFETLEVPRGASYIGYDAFGKCMGLKKLSVPFVGETPAANVFLSYVFGNADYSSGGSMCVPSSLEIVEVTNATAIGYYAFNNCDDIREVILPDGLLTIGRYAFSGCDSLTSLEVPNSVTEISAGAFFNSAFEELSLPFVGRSRSTVANEYDETKQLSYVFNSEYYYMPQTLKKITITDSRYIVVNAFTGFTELEQITLDCAMEYISYNAFDGCYRLFEVFDYGSRLNIVKGSIDNGGIAQYALKVHTDRGEAPLPQYKSEDYRFVRDDDGNMHMLDCKQDEETLILPSTVALDGITVNNYSVWRRLFYGNGAITAVVIPASVTDLGETAFGGCNNLERVEFAANSLIKQIKAETFMFCNSLYELTLPQGLTQIEMLAFYNCSRLKKITVPSGVTAIRDGAFLNCQRLFEVYNHSALNIVVGSTDHGGIAENARAVYKDDSQSIDSVTVNGVQYMKLGDGGTDWWAVDYYGSDGVLEIKPFAYNGATIDRIGVYDSAFSNNYRILSAVISNAVAQIDRQFSTCYNLSEVRLVGGGANAKMTISDEAFVYCYNLAQFISETPVSSIGKHAFRTDNISLIRFEARVDSVSAEAFYNENTNSIFNAEFADVGTFETRSVASANLNSIKATGTVDAIAQNAFIGQNMTSAEFADVGEIGSYAFANCTSLKTAKFGNVDKIGDYAFSYTGLTSATFGRVNSIGASAFIGTRSLNRIVLAQNDGLTIGNAAFERSGLTSFTYGGKISSIGTGAFTSNSNLSRVSFGEVGTIGSNAFRDCHTLTPLEFAGNVDQIGEYAFRYAPMSSLVFGGKV